MRVVVAIADRMLSAVVPRARAGACCPPDGQEVICYRSGCHTYLKYCHYNCACKYECALPGDARPDAWLPAGAVRHGPRVPVGKFVALGDNTARSYGSRQLGYFPGDRLLGVVLRRVR